MRPAPAFQEYASDILAQAAYKNMSLAERGLWHSMRLQCWVDGGVPADPETLANLLHLDVDEVKQAMTPFVRQYFDPEGEGSRRLVCVELEDYRADQMKKRQQRSDAGRAGSERRWRGRVVDGESSYLPRTVGGDGLPGDDSPPF